MSKGNLSKAGGTIGAAIDAGVSLFNTYMQARQNKKDRQFQEHMYNRQRIDANADAAFQNKYNSPAEQMKRYKEAGLNANLVYGTAGQSVAADIRSSQPSGGNQPAPQVQENVLSKALQGFMQIINTQQNTNNLEKQAELIAAETERQKFELSRGKQLLPYQLTAAELSNKLADATVDKVDYEIEQIKANTQFTLNSDQRAAIRQGADLKKIAEDILKSRMERMEIAQRIAKSKSEQEEIGYRIQELKAATSGKLLANQIEAFYVDMVNKGIDPKSNEFVKQFQLMMDNILNSTPISSQQREKNNYGPQGTMKR